MTVKNGDKIKVEYTGTLEDGSEFDSTSKHGQPLGFEVGKGQLIKGFDEAVVGMKKGDEKEIKLPPEEAYGQYNDGLIKKVPKEHLPKGKEFKPGMMLLLGTPEGARMPAKIKEVTDKDVTIDLNHPLVGKTLNFKIKVVGINEPEEKKGSCADPGCGCGS